MAYAHRATAREGFSLIEIMFAISIMLIMMAIVGPNVLRFINSARKSNAQSTVRNLEQAISMFNANTGQNPARLNDLIKRPADERIAKKWEGPYLKSKEVPVDPWGERYQYKLTPQGEHKYELFSYGPNGKGSPKAEHIDVWDL